MKKKIKEKGTGIIDRGMLIPHIKHVAWIGIIIGILILLATGVGVISATTITVYPGESIQEAINNLPAEGGVIELAPGIHDVKDTLYPPQSHDYYNGNCVHYSIWVNKSNVTIAGTNESIIKHYNNSLALFYIPDLGGAHLENITFDGFQVMSDYTTRGGVLNDVFVAIHVDGLIIKNIYSVAHTYYFMRIFSDQGYQRFSKNIYFENNILYNCGIFVSFSSNNHVINNSIITKLGNLQMDRNCVYSYIIGNYVDLAGGESNRMAITIDVGQYYTVQDNIVTNAHRGYWITAGPSNVVLSNNTATYMEYAGIHIHDQFGSNNLTIRNNFLYDNTGHGIVVKDHGYSMQYGEADIRNNVIYNNGGDGIRLESEYDRCNISNNIIANNCGYGINNIKTNEGTEHTYNNIWSNAQHYFGTTEGVGEIHKNPQFVDPANGDFYLKSQYGRWDGAEWVIDPPEDHSPCIDAGDPSSDHSNEPDYPLGYINGGAYGNTEEASMGGPDTIPPTITAHSPTGTDVFVGTPITATFSEAMNKSSVQNAFSVSPSVTGSFSWNGNKMVFTPDSNLDYDTSYTVTISTSAEDLAENNLETEYNWQFTTITTGVWSSGWESEKALVNADWPSSHYQYLYPHLAYNLRGDGKWIIITGTDVNNGLFGYYYNSSENEWIKDDSLVNGLVVHGWYEYPALAYNVTGDNKWTLITHHNTGFYGYYWDGTQWIEDSSRANGLPIISGRISHTFIEDLTGDGKRTLITGVDVATFRAFYWDGTQWIEDSSRVNGLPDVGSYSRLTAGFNVFGDNKWNIIAGDYGGSALRAFYWDGRQWIEDTTKAAGLNTDSSHLVPTIGYNLRGDGKWMLISGVNQYETLLGWFYNSVDTSSLPLQADIFSYHNLATTVYISFSYPYTWNHRIKYSTNPDMSNALWSEWYKDKDMNNEYIKLKGLSPNTKYYYEVYTYVPWDTSYYIKSSVNSVTTLPAQNPVVVNPGESIVDALEMLPLEGGTIELAPGTYDVYETIITDRNNITIQGTHSAIVKHHAENGAWDACFEIPHGGYRNITFKGFSTTSSYTYSYCRIFLADEVTNFTVENIYDTSHSAYLAAVFSAQEDPRYSKNIFFRDNIIENRGSLGTTFSENIHFVNNTLYRGTLDINRNNEDMYVHDNYVIRQYDWCIRAHSGTNVYVYNNTLEGGQAGIYNDGVSNLEFYNNTIIGATTAGIWMNPQNILTNQTYRNNRICNCARGVYTTHYPSGFSEKISDADIINNIVYNSRGDGIQMSSEYVQLGIKNNIIANNSGYGINYKETINPTTISYNDVWQNALGDYNSISACTGDINKDPLFVDAKNGNFHLKSTAEGWNEHSPCIDAGVPYEKDPVYGDYSKEPAPNGGRINMGAYGNTEEASKSSGINIYSTAGYVKYAVNGTEISGAYVTNNVTSAETYTNARGYYVLTGLTNGTYTVTASKPGF